MIFLSWNVRGINNPLKDNSIKSEIIKNKAKFVGLTETKLLDCPQTKVSSLRGNKPVNFEAAHALSSNSGGLLLMWNPSYFHSHSCIKGNRWIVVIGNIIPLQWRCAIGLIYDEYSTENQNLMYSELSSAMTEISDPIMLFGDYNQILYINERKNQSIETTGMRNFISWIISESLIDMPLVGRKFTWQRNNSRSRIDRCLVSPDWIQRFPSLKLKGLNNSVSDHVILIVTLEDQTSWGPKSFKYLNS